MSSAAPATVSGERVQHRHCPMRREGKDPPRSASQETGLASTQTAVGCDGQEEPCISNQALSTGPRSG